MPVRTIVRDLHGRSGARVGVPLSRVPAADRRRLLRAAAVTLAGAFQTWERVGDSGRRAWFRWCPNCGATVMFVNEGYEDMPAIPIGAFADDDAPTPTLSIFEGSKLPWVAVAGEGIEHFA